MMDLVEKRREAEEKRREEKMQSAPARAVR
jgi:hypothetical protein